MCKIRPHPFRTHPKARDTRHVARYYIVADIRVKYYDKIILNFITENFF